MPGIVGVVEVCGEHGCQLEEVQQVLQPPIDLCVGHLCNVSLSGCQYLTDVSVTEHNQVSIINLHFFSIINLAVPTILSRPHIHSSRS